MSDTRFYVYGLVDPRDGAVFYVGKGCCARCAHHECQARIGRVQNQAKHERIAAILASGVSVEYVFFGQKLGNREALDLERETIDRLRWEGVRLTNAIARVPLSVAVPASKCLSEAEYLLAHMAPFETWRTTLKKPWDEDGDYQAVKVGLERLAERCRHDLRSGEMV